MWNASLCSKQLRVQTKNAVVIITDFEDSFDERRPKNYKIKLISAQRAAFSYIFYAIAFSFSVIICFILFKEKFENVV